MASMPAAARYNDVQLMACLWMYAESFRLLGQERLATRLRDDLGLTFCRWNEDAFNVLMDELGYPPA